MKIVLVQPPFVQLNTPYPAPYYLKSFLEKNGHEASVLDHSIGLFERIFCRAGLEKIFTDAEAGIDEKTPVEAYRFISEKDKWIVSIDGVTAFLRGQNREWAHIAALANGVLPGGPRFDATVENTRGSPSPEDAPILASALLADIADFITAVLDPAFGLVRYIPSLAGNSFADFAEFEKRLDGYIMREFYEPYLEESLQAIICETGAHFLLGVTVPFPGCLAGALVCARAAKRLFGGQVTTVAGGGYVNTELRFTDPAILKTYFDHLILDKGYHELLSLMTEEHSEASSCRSRGSWLIDLDNHAAATTFPDYSSVDFSRYLCPVDDKNPMHRLWSDGRWLKAYLAYGCYWHSCAFCDTTLDYIRCYLPVDVEAFFTHMRAEADATGVRGVHLVDEAAPPESLLKLALLNREAELPLMFWGNIRYEKRFTPELAAVLASGGLVGVSAGIEVATEGGLKRMGKGSTLQEIVSACAAFKEAGVLTHGYLIYGYYDESEQEIIDSAEVVRQFFEAGLLDSAFWHQFTLTRHSRVYAEKERGLHPELRVKDAPASHHTSGRFALNDLSFEGEERFNKFGSPLDALLSQWMAGYTDATIASAFPFKTPHTTIAPYYIEEMLNEYAERRDVLRCTPPEPGAKAVFLGSRPIAARHGALFWRYKLSDCVLKTASPDDAKAIASLLIRTSSEAVDACEIYDAVNEDWEYMCNNGLVII